LEDRSISIFLESLNVTIPSEVHGVKAQGKPRLRKDTADRSKLHLPQLVMALARLPQPARQDKLHSVTFPLENKAYVMDEMNFDIIDDDGLVATIAPLSVTIRNSNFRINLEDRFAAIAADHAALPEIRSSHPNLAAAIERHWDEVQKATNSSAISNAANEVIKLQSEIFGMTNAGSAYATEKAAKLPETELEAEIKGREGKLLTRIHVYKERDRKFAELVKKHSRNKSGGKLTCEVCGLTPADKYGPAGERCIEAHHKIPIEQLQPDSITLVEDMAIVCANCHRLIHSSRPCLTIDEASALIKA
jgi:predicted HNH restriction endonuclease